MTGVQPHRIRILGASIGLGLPVAASIALYWAQRLGPPRPTVIGALLSAAAVGIIVGPFVGAARAPHVVLEARQLRSAVIAAMLASVGGVLAFGLLVVLFEALNAALDLGGWPGVALQAYLMFFLPALLGAFVAALPFAVTAVVILRRLARVGVPGYLAATLVAFLVLAGGATALDAARTLPPPDPLAQVALHIVAINSGHLDTGVETGFQSGARTTWAPIPACKVTMIDAEVDGDWELRVMTHAEFDDWPRPIPPPDISAAYLPRNLDPATVTIDLTTSHVDVHAGFPSQLPTGGTCANP